MGEKTKLECDLLSIGKTIDQYKNSIVGLDILIMEKQDLLKMANNEIAISDLVSVINDLENERKTLESKIYNLKEQEYQIREALNIYNYQFVNSNGIIDLYKRNLELSGTYNIYLHKNKVKVGEINYLPDGDKDMFGNVGCMIIESYRGNGYAYQALCILADYLLLHNIDKIILTTKRDNIASIKILDKFKKNVFDAEVIDYYVDNITGKRNMDILVYKYKLRNMKKHLDIFTNNNDNENNQHFKK